jgi:hypothetical protein
MQEEQAVRLAPLSTDSFLHYEKTLAKNSEVPCSKIVIAPNPARKHSSALSAVGVTKHHRIKPTIKAPIPIQSNAISRYQ